MKRLFLILTFGLSFFLARSQSSNNGSQNPQQLAEDCVITQGISPNEDSRNDCMDLSCLNDLLGVKRFSVFNRYGKEVFDQKNYTNTFCGQDENGDKLSTGTYFYVIELNNSNDRFDRVVKGWVYINIEQ